MAAFDHTNVDPFLKHRYKPAAVEIESFTDHPNLAMVKKTTDFGAGGTAEGTLLLTVGTEHPQGASAGFSQAQTNAALGYTRGTRFAIDTVNVYQMANVTGKLLRATQNNKNSLINALEEAVGGTLKALSRKTAVQLFRQGWGSLGTSATAAAAQDNLTLENIEDAVNFAAGMTIVASSAIELATLRNAGASLIVSKVDYPNGKVYFTTNINDIAALAVGDHLFAKGDRENSATPTRLCLTGYADWVPDTAPTAGETFHGKDRSGNSRLFGGAIDCAGKPMLEGITKGMVSCFRWGGYPTHLFLNPENYGDLMLELQTKGRYDTMTIKAGSSLSIGIPAVQVYTMYGQLTVVMDRECPIDHGYLLNFPQWELGSIGEFPSLLEHGTGQNKAIAQASADGIEIRCGGYPQLYTPTPGANAVLKF